MNPPPAAVSPVGPLAPVSGPALGPPGAGIDGAILFVRYAYPPNERGACGPDDSRALFEYGAGGIVDEGLVRLARGFSGAWPYLELIAATTGIGNPLDARVVEAYWLGNSLLAGIDMQLFGNSLVDRFRRRAGPAWGYVADAVPVGAVPNHAFHVFGVYPWVGLLGWDRPETPLHVLDRCRIRWGQVVTVAGDEAVVLSRPLTWDGSALGVGEPRAETARRSIGGLSLVGDIRPGDWVSLHWDWVCDRLSRRQLANLRRYTLRQLEITNRRAAHPGLQAALE